MTRFGVGLATDAVLHPDEVFQYLEQAHRLVFGPGMIPWEYEYGIRSWLVPLGIGLILKPLQLIGLDTPQAYQPLVKAALSAGSLVIPYGIYRLARNLVNDAVARLALIFAAFWYELIIYAHRATIDVLATYTAIAAITLLLTSTHRRIIAGSGALAGLTIVLRFQLLPLVGVMGAVALWRWRVSMWPWTVACLLVVAAGGALDYYTWGTWFSSIVVNFQLNLVNGVASQFGTDPAYWYLATLVVLSGGLVCPGAIGLLLTIRRSWPLMAMGVVALAVFSVIGHKETRYVFFLIPLWLLGLAAFAANRGELLAAAVPRAARIAPWMARGVVGGFAVISALGLFNLLPFESRVLPDSIARSDARRAYRALARSEDMVAVLDLTGSDPWSLAPYYDLHRDVPIYWPLSTGFETVRQDPQRYASHVMARASFDPPEGFHASMRVGHVVIWRRVADPPVTVPPPEYTTRIRPQPRVGLPTVNPRW
jgi:phosphatidylinositol glycan class B